MHATLAHFRMLVRSLLLLTLAWAAVVVTSTLLDDRRFRHASQPACAVLESAHAVRDGPQAWPWARNGQDSGDWRVRARYSYVVAGVAHTGTQVWAWGHDGSRDNVHDAAQEMRQQQRERGCVRVTVQSDEPARAIVFQAPLKAYMQRQMASIAPVFLLLLVMEMAMAVWAGWREAKHAAAAGRASAT